MPYNIPEGLTGLTNDELTASRQRYGYNRLEVAHKNTWFNVLIDILKEPMLILLIIISLIYVIIGDYEAAWLPLMKK